MGVELLDGIGWTAISLFASPILWLAILVSFVLSMRRVKRERNLFRSRTRSKRTDVFETLVPGLVVGLVLSIVSLSLRLTISTEFLLGLMGLTGLILLTGVIRFNLPLWPLVILAGIGWFVTDDRVEGLKDVGATDLLLLAALSLAAELILLAWRGKKKLSPSLVLSKRGRYIGGLVCQQALVDSACRPRPGQQPGSVDSTMVVSGVCSDRLIPADRLQFPLYRTITGTVDPTARPGTSDHVPAGCPADGRGFPDRTKRMVVRVACAACRPSDSPSADKTLESFTDPVVLEWKAWCRHPWNAA